MSWEGVDFKLGEAEFFFAAMEDYGALERLYEDPSFTFVDQTLFGAWGRRAS